MPDVDAQMAAALRQAKTTPMHFALVAKSAAEGTLIVTKKKISVKEITEARTTLGGGRIYRGRCQSAAGQMVFEVAKEPPASLANLIKRIIHRDAGLTMSVDVRVAAELEDEGDDLEEVGAAPPAEPEITRFNTHLKAVMKKVIALPANHARRGAAETGLSEAQGLAKKDRWAEAHDRLDRVEGSLSKSSAKLKAHQPAAGEKKKSSAELKAHQPAAGEKKKSSAELKSHQPTAENKKSSAGMKAHQPTAENKKSSARLKAYQPATAENKKSSAKLKAVDAAAPAKGKLVALQQARLVWSQTRQMVRAEIEKLESSILAACKEEPDFSEIVTGAKDLYAMLDVLDERLIDKLDEALNAGTPEERAERNAEAHDIVEDYIDFVDSDSLIAEIDENGFTNVKVRSTLTNTLKVLASKLA